MIRPQLKLLTAIELDHELALALSLRLTQTNVTVVEGDATSMPFESERFTGAMAFTMFHHVTTVDLQDRMLAEILRVLRPGGRFVASDSVASGNLAELHIGDVYNPIDPATLETRLSAVGFGDIEIKNFAWRCHAHRSD